MTWKRILGTTVITAALTVGTSSAVLAGEIAPAAANSDTAVSTMDEEYPGKHVIRSREAWAKFKEEAASKPAFLLYSSPAWCGPCRQAEPMLNKVTKEGGGAFLMATINDQQMRYTDIGKPPGFRGWPSVYAYKDGRPVGQSVTHPLNGERAHRSWLKQWLGV